MTEKTTLPQEYTVMEKAALADRSTGADTKAKAKKPLDAAVLRGLIAQIEAGNNNLGRDSLVQALAALPHAKIDTSGSAALVRLAGIETTNTAGLAQALTTWCSKARRACLSGEAV